MKHSDLIIIGAGPGGYETASKAAKAGLSTVIVESGFVGGTCLNEGCIPTKCFCHNADVLRELKQADALGISVPSYSFCIKKAVERKDQIVQTLTSGIEILLKNPLISLVRGKAQFTNAHTIHVENVEGETDFNADNIIIATGSVTKYLPIDGNHLPKVLDSSQMLNLKEIPKRLCIIGGGVIGMEFASIFNTFGSEVTVVEFLKEILPNFDNDISKRLKQSLQAQGVKIINNAAVSAIKETEKGLSVYYKLKEEEQSVEADIALMAVGRTANTASLNLADVGIAIDRKGIIVDENFQTNVKGIYAIGDVNGIIQLAHAASFQGMYVLSLITSQKHFPKLHLIPSTVFTYPEVSMVGLTLEACKQKEIAVKTHKAFFRANGKALTINEPEGLVKVLTNEEGQILGCHILGAHASDLIHEVTVLMAKNGTLEDLAQVVHAHPTLSEVILSVSEN